MSKFYDVIIGGAGPVGLFLACDLALTKTSVLVLESSPTVESPWKVMPLGGRNLNTPSVENIYRRGMLDKVFETSQRPSYHEKKPGFQFGGHFAGIPLNANKLDLDRWKYRLSGPALVPGRATIDRIESILIERAENLGVTILRGHGVTKFSQNSDSVTVEAGEENQSFQGRYLVGCDGGRSVIRKGAEFDFVGTEAKFTGYAVKFDFQNPENLKMGFHVTKEGMYINLGSNALYMTDFDRGAFDRTQEITQERVQSILDRISERTDMKISKMHLASSFTDRCKQTTHYRKGRVLLAGDAAHIHGPVGSQGLNLGLGDAINLGWKLAATIRQESQLKEAEAIDLALLDTYESERHPIGAWVLEWTRAQVMMLSPDGFGQAVQSLIRDLIDTDDGTNMFLGRHWGLSQRYKLGESEAQAHPLVGCSAPDFELSDGSRLGSKLEAGRGLLVDFEDNAKLRDLVVSGDFEGRIEYAGVSAKDMRGLRALLVRPDGIVAWVAEENVKPDVEEVKAALEQWFRF
ncbi:MAG: hypothetical protein L6R41_005065 [Letrouitia leprolyta]|nr:MAG: hypothetical protein L6R41_005065 [Letrouitia leprolyta]